MIEAEIILHTTDLERAKHFYSAIAEEMGYELYKFSDTIVTNCWVISNNLHLILVPVSDVEQTEGRGGIKICLYAEEIYQVDSVYARVVDLGATDLDEPNTPDAFYRASFCDPDGHRIEIACGI